MRTTRNYRQTQPEPRHLETQLGIETWLLTAAMNFVAAQQPAEHHSRATRAHWKAAQQDTLTLLRAQLTLHMERFEAQDNERRSHMAHGA